MLAAGIDGGLIDTRVAAVGDDCLGVLLNTFRIPHLTGSADHCGHRRVNDHIAGYVKIGNAAIRVDHRESRSLCIGPLDFALDLISFVFR